jgi:eukaryotic-like serine/threonine-protein kinase
MTTEHAEPRPSADDPARSVTLGGRYRTVSPGVASAEAVVYAAEDVATSRAVRLSVLRGEAAADAEFVATVREQAYRLAKPACDHPALVRVYDVGTTDESEPFIALEPVVGRSLREVLDERGTLDLHDSLRLAIQIGEGLETLHSSGIVHGELRPESIVLVKDENGRDGVKLVGVELTAARRAASRLLPRDETVAAYLAPEQIARAETTEASDIYALGVLILELLTGHRPHGTGARDAAEFPAAIARIVAKALEEGPGRRYSSISLMLNDMWTAESEPATSLARPEAPRPVAGERRPPRRARAHVGVATALVVGLVLVGVTVWVARTDRLAQSVSPDEAVVAETPAALPQRGTPPPTISAEPTLPARPEAPERSDPAQFASPSAPEVAPAAAPKPTAIGTVVRAPRPVGRQPERPARSEQRSADGADGTAIIDWLLKGGRSGG